MKFTRRNTLIGLGSLVAGSGALVGTGAFTTTEADRSVTVNTAGDRSAALGLEGDEEYVDDDNRDNGMLTVNLGGDGTPLNDDARTRLSGVVTVSDNSPDTNDIKLGFDDDQTVNGLSANVTLSLDDADVTFYISNDEDSFTSGTGQAVTINNGGSAYIDALVDTTVRNNGVDPSDTLTIVATEP